MEREQSLLNTSLKCLKIADSPLWFEYLKTAKRTKVRARKSQKRCVEKKLVYSPFLQSIAKFNTQCSLRAGCGAN
jgi:hypothetical protein